MDDTSHRSHRRAGGLGVRVAWDGAGLSPAVEGALAYLGPEASPGSDPLVVHVGAGPLAVPEGAEPVRETAEGLVVFRQGDALWLRARGAVARVEPARGAARVAVGEGPLRGALVYSLLFYALAALLDGRGRRVLHGACLARDGWGLLLVGQSDSGKSTLAVRLAEAGWDALTDDSVVIGPAGGGVRAWPLRRDFCLDPEAEALFPWAADHWEPHVADPGKRRLRIGERWPGGPAASCVLRAVVFPRVVDASESRLVSLSAGEALLGLLRHTGAPGVAASGDAAAHLDALRLLAGQCQAWALHAGRDLRDDAGAADRLLRHALADAPVPTP